LEISQSGSSRRRLGLAAPICFSGLTVHPACLPYRIGLVSHVEFLNNKTHYSRPFPFKFNCSLSKVVESNIMQLSASFLREGHHNGTTAKTLFAGN